MEASSMCGLASGSLGASLWPRSFVVRGACRGSRPLRKRSSRVSPSEGRRFQLVVGASRRLNSQQLSCCHGRQRKVGASGKAQAHRQRQYRVVAPGEVSGLERRDAQPFHGEDVKRATPFRRLSCQTLAVMYATVTSSFEENVRDVERLIDFDRDVVDIMIMSLEGLKTDVPQQVHSLKGRIDRVIHIVKGIREHESLKSKYGTVCNQAVVLLVSHFASALGDLFRKAVSVSLESETNETLLDEELKLTFREIKERSWNIKGAAGDLIIAKKDLTFQDMQSTVRAFDTYAGVQIEKDQRVNNIILGQAARHVIVHASAHVTDRMIKQVAKAAPRSLKQSLEVGAPLVFSKEEVLELKAEMTGFVASLIEKLEAAK
jgi:hypothetical protein